MNLKFQDCPKAIHKMMKECWRENRTQRPSFEDLAQFLDKMITSPELLNDDMADQVNCKRYFSNCLLFMYMKNFPIFSFYSQRLFIMHLVFGLLV